MKKNLCLFIFLILVSGPNPILAQNLDSLKLGTWKTIKEGYTLQYPGTWTFDNSGKSGSTFFISSPRENDQDLFTENVNLVIQDLGEEGLDLSKYMDLTLNQVKTLIPNGIILENTTLSGKSGEYQRLIWTGDISGHNLKFEQFIFVHGKKAEVLTLTVEPQKWNRYKSVGESILKSFAPNF